MPARQARIVEQQLPGGRNRAISSTTVITKTVKNHMSSKPSNSSAGHASTSTVVIRRETSAANGSQSRMKPKAAPLMQKSMQLFKSRFRR